MTDNAKTDNVLVHIRDDNGGIITHTIEDAEVVTYPGRERISDSGQEQWLILAKDNGTEAVYDLNEIVGYEVSV